MFKRSLPVLALGLFTAASLNAATVFTDDFESYTPGLDLSVSTSPRLYNGLNVADESTATPFGSPNQYGYLDGGSSFVRVNSVSTLMTYSFDLFEPDTAQTGTVRFGIGNGDLNAANTHVAWTLNNGTLATSFNTSTVSGSLPTLQENRHYVVYLLHNGSGSAETIDGLGKSLGAGQTALYFYDTISATLLEGGVFGHTASVTPTAFLIRSTSADDNTVFFDNVVRQDTLVVPTMIPEPASAALALGGMALLAASRHRWRLTAR